MSIDPATASLALSAVSTASSIVGGISQANQQASANEQQRLNSLKAMRANLVQSNMEQEQERQAATQKANQARKEGMKLESTAKLAALESGVTGNSVDALMRDLAGQTLENTTNIESNYLRATERIGLDRQNITNRAQSEINSLRAPTTPDILGNSLSFGQAYVGYRKDQGKQLF